MIEKSIFREHAEYLGMYYYKKPNNRWSKDFYNISWARENQKREYENEGKVRP